MKAVEKIAVIADDYTGAGDSGIHFSRAGRRMDLLLDWGLLGEQVGRGGSVSLTTESRFLDPERAAVRVAELIGRCREAGFTHFFKKIDSTLRGNPGSEIESALKATGRRAALVCTAMPETGRTCVGGILSIDGVVLRETEIGNDPCNPVATSSVHELLSHQTSLAAGPLSIRDIEAGASGLAEKIASLVEGGIRLILADAELDTHLLALAGQIGGADLLPVGAGGLARALAKSWQAGGLAGGGTAVVKVRGPILAVIGSLTGVSRRQADCACDSGMFEPFEIDPEGGGGDIEHACAAWLANDGATRRNILVRVKENDRPRRVSTDEAERVARMLGKAASVICRSYPCRTVFTTGGSTSMEIARALGIQAVTLVDELMSGVVLGSCSVPNTFLEWFISKAGGFGNEEILNTIAAECAADTTGVRNHVE